MWHCSEGATTNFHLTSILRVNRVHLRRPAELKPTDIFQPAPESNPSIEVDAFEIAGICRDTLGPHTAQTCSEHQRSRRGLTCCAAQPRSLSGDNDAATLFSTHPPLLATTTIFP